MELLLDLARGHLPHPPHRYLPERGQLPAPLSYNHHLVSHYINYSAGYVPAGRRVRSQRVEKIGQGLGPLLTVALVEQR